MAPLVEDGRIAVLGVVQEQHPDRGRLYRQWRELEWPIAVDAMNTLGLAAVPVPMLIDEHGVIRAIRPSPERVEAFLAAEFGPVETPEDWRPAAETTVPVEQATRGFLSGDADALTPAIEALRAKVTRLPGSAVAWFRLGVALKRRSETNSSDAAPDDAQRAVEAWGRALELNPNQYIWRRRIQQYGPRLDKPYDFYSWVERARADIVARGETPVALGTEPAGSEILRKTEAAVRPESPDPDPEGRLARDDAGRVELTTMVTPAVVRPGAAVRVRVTFRVDREPVAWWNNEGDGLALHVETPEGWRLTEGALRHVLRGSVTAESQARRVLEFELSVPLDVESGSHELGGYAVYEVCDDVDGVCLRLRQDLIVPIRVASK